MLENMIGKSTAIDRVMAGKELTFDDGMESLHRRNIVHRLYIMSLHIYTGWIPSLEPSMDIHEDSSVHRRTQTLAS